MGMVLTGLGKSRNAVVAVPQDFNAKAVMLLEGTECKGKDCISRRTRSSETYRKMQAGSGGLHHGVGSIHL
jgi:hypothetical protein